MMGQEVFKTFSLVKHVLNFFSVAYGLAPRPCVQGSQVWFLVEAPDFQSTFPLTKRLYSHARFLSYPCKNAIGVNRTNKKKLLSFYRTFSLLQQCMSCLSVHCNYFHLKNSFIKTELLEALICDTFSKSADCR